MFPVSIEIVPDDGDGITYVARFELPTRGDLAVIGAHIGEDLTLDFPISSPKAAIRPIKATPKGDK